MIELAQALHVVSVPSNVIEDLVGGAARTLGVDSELVVLQSYVLAETVENGQRRAELHKIPFEGHWQMARMHELLALGRSLAGGSRDIEEGRDELRRINASVTGYAKAPVVVAYGVYSAAVAARVGGAWLEMAVAAAAGVIAGLIHYRTIRSRTVDLLQSFVAGLLGSLAVLVLAAFLPTFDLAPALFGGAVLLVPAMVVATGIEELTADALESGVIRLAYGLLRFLMLAAGILAALNLWRLFADVPASAHGKALPTPTVLGILVVGGAALVLCLQARLRDLHWVVLAVLVAFGTQELTKAFIPDGAPLVSAFVLGVAAKLHARIPGNVPATMVVPGLLQLAPGFVGTQGILHLLAGSPESSDSFFRVLLIAFQLVVGLMIASAVFKRRGFGSC